MQRDNVKLKSLALTVLALAAVAAHALPPPLPAGATPVAGLPPLVGASAPEASKSLTVAAVQAVAVGKGASAPAEVRNGTMRELEELQRLTAIAEARKRLAEASATQGATVTAAAATPAPSGGDHVAAVAGTQSPAGVHVRARKRMVHVVSVPTLPSPPVEAIVAPPTAKLVQLMVVGGHKRADVVDGGRVLTVKEGDPIGDWVVSDIDASGVTVEHRRAGHASVSMATPVVDAAASSSMALALPAAASFVSSQHSSGDDVVRTLKLESARATDLPYSSTNTGSSAVPAFAVPMTTSGVAPPVIPPLPPVVKTPDSSQQTAALPLLPVRN